MEPNESPLGKTDEEGLDHGIPIPLEPLRSLAVAVELIPMRSKMALYMFLRNHETEFPPRYMPGRMGQQVRMLYDNEILKIRKMLLIEDGSDYYHGEGFKQRLPSTGRPRTRPRSAIEYVMQRALTR